MSELISNKTNGSFGSIGSIEMEKIISELAVLKKEVHRLTIVNDYLQKQIDDIVFEKSNKLLRSTCIDGLREQNEMPMFDIENPPIERRCLTLGEINPDLDTYLANGGDYWDYMENMYKTPKKNDFDQFTFDTIIQFDV